MLLFSDVVVGNSDFNVIFLDGFFRSQKIKKTGLLEANFMCCG
jgi:hypothetical protein